MSTRTWRYPDLRNGTTIALLADTHIGTSQWPTFAQNWLQRAETDLEYLKVAVNGGLVHAGDMINGYADYPGGPNGTQATINAETSWYLAWRDAIKAATGLPFAECVGNHDLLGPATNTDGTAHSGITSQQWATSVGLDSPNNVYQMGDLNVICLAPYDWQQPTESGPIAPYVIPQTTLDWLDTQLSASSAPTFITTHAPPDEQYPGEPVTADNSSATPHLDDVIGAHDNVIGWLSGHRHEIVQEDSSHATTITVGGRTIFGLNGPSTGGMAHLDERQWGPIGNWPRGQYGASLWLTLLDEQTLDVRWRNHNTAQWTSTDYAGYETHQLLSLAGA